MNFNPSEVFICVSAFNEIEWNKYTRRLVKKLLNLGFYDYRVKVGPYLDLNRNLSVVPSLKDYKKLNPHVKKYLHLDCDNEPTIDDIFRLLDQPYPIIGYTYVKNGEPDQLTAIDLKGNNISSDTDRKGIEIVMANGLGCFAVDSEVYENVPFPYYQTGYVQTQDGLQYVNEDYYFCLAAQRKGYPVRCDFDTRIIHRTRDPKELAKSFQL